MVPLYRRTRILSALGRITSAWKDLEPEIVGDPVDGLRQLGEDAEPREPGN